MEGAADPGAKALPSLLALRAQQEPDRIVMQDVEGRSDTYASLHDAMCWWADVLQGLSIRPGDSVAMRLPTGLEAYRAWMGCARLGAMAVPLNTEYRGETLCHALGVCKARILLCESEFLPILAQVAPRLPLLETAIVIDWEEHPASEAGQQALSFRLLALGQCDGLRGDANTVPWPHLKDIAAVIFTSGTTGPSKGVLVPWGELMGSHEIWPFHGDGTDVYYAPFPMFHVTGLNPLVQMLELRGRVILRKKFSVHAFWEDIRRFGCTATVLLGSMATFLMQAKPAEGKADNPLETVLMAPVIPDYRAFGERFGLRVITCYGMTEIGWPLSSNGQWPENAQTCGLVRDGWECRIVDEDECPVPPGDIGQLLVRSSKPWTMMQGYLNNDAATVEAWRNGWFHTGDAFRQDSSGLYYFVDRMKDTIRRRGENISSVEVEAEVLAFPAVAEAAAVGVPSATMEEDVKVFVVPAAGCTVDPHELFRFLEARSPWFMVPRYIEIVNSMPLTETAKVRKVDLRAKGNSTATWDRCRFGYKA